MKKIILFVISGIVLISINTFAADGDFIVEGNVGIGTDAPLTKLDVRSGNPTGYLGSSDYGAIFATENPSSHFVGIESDIQRSNTNSLNQSAFGAKMSAVYTGSGEVS